MGSQILFYVGMALVILPLTFIIVQAIIDYRMPGWKEELHHQFLEQWNGTPEDEINAWIKIRYRLLHQDASEEKLNFVNRKIANLDKSKFISSTYVTSDGTWVEERDVKRPYHNA